MFVAYFLLIVERKIPDLAVDEVNPAHSSARR